MRFMVMHYSDEANEADAPPSPELLAEMGAYMEEPAKAGVLLAAEGVQPSSHGARVRFTGTARHGHRWPVRRDQGADRRLRHPRGEVDGGGHRAGQALRPISGATEIEIRQVAEILGDATVASRGCRRARHAAERRADRPTADVRTPRAIDAVWRIESAKAHRPAWRGWSRDVGAGRGPGAGRAGRRPRAVAPDRRPGQPGRVAHGHRQAPARSTCCAGASPRAQARGARPRAGGRARAAEPDLDAALDDDVGDDLLRLIFIACHPVLSTEARVALTLRLLGGLTTEEIARAFLVPEPTVAQRIVRAKRTLAEARVPFEVPRGPSSATRLASVLEVIYLVFNEGYSATAGDDWVRPALCEDALRLGRILAGLAPDGARGPRPRGADGDPGVAAARARRRPRASRSCCSTRTAALGPAADPPRPRRARPRRGAGRPRAPTRCRPPSPPATRARTGRGDRLGADRRALRRARRGRALAGRRAEPGGGAVDGVRPGGRARAGRRARSTSPALRATTCCRLGRGDEARAEFERAASLTRNGPERAVLLGRAAQVRRPRRRPVRRPADGRRQRRRRALTAPGWTSGRRAGIVPSDERLVGLYRGPQLSPSRRRPPHGRSP